MRKLLYTFFIILLSSNFIFSQSQKILNLEKKLKTASSKNEILLLNTLAETYLDYNTDKSIELANRALKKVKDNDQITANLYNTIGAAYFYKKKYRKSIKFYEKELTITEKTASKKDVIKANYNIAVIYQKWGKKRKSRKRFLKSLELAKKIKSNNFTLYNYKALYELHLNWGKYKDALAYLQKYIKLKDNSFSNYREKQISILRKKYRKEKQLRKQTENSLFATKDTLIKTNNIKEKLINDTTEKASKINMLTLQKELAQKVNIQKEKIHKAELKLKEIELERKKSEAFLFLIIGGLFLVSGIWVFVLYRDKKKANLLLNKQKDEIQTQADLIKEKNTQIIDSIEYARRIQDSILIPENEIKKYLPEAFILYKPKDIVSGDFYWFSKIKEELVLATIDCTGHGVPGAFMSLIGNMLLNEIVNEKKITKPDLILKKLHIGVMAALKQSGDSSADDGMDMSLCTINPRLKRFRFAGAKNHLYVMQGDKLKILRANVHSVGGRPLRSDITVEFTSFDFMYDENTQIYMMSDGYMDQFGGLKNTKFNAKRFKQMLIDNRALPMKQQKEIIEDRFEEWKGEGDQVDDILIVGVKLE